jgi:hypothetical protein
MADDMGQNQSSHHQFPRNPDESQGFPGIPGEFEGIARNYSLPLKIPEEFSGIPRNPGEYEGIIPGNSQRDSRGPCGDGKDPKITSSRLPLFIPAHSLPFPLILRCMRFAIFPNMAILIPAHSRPFPP